MIAGLVLVMLTSIFSNLRQVNAGLLGWNLEVIFPSCLATSSLSPNLFPWHASNFDVGSTNCLMRTIIAFLVCETIVAKFL